MYGGEEGQPQQFLVRGFIQALFNFIQALFNFIQALFNFIQADVSFTQNSFCTFLLNNLNFEQNNQKNLE